MSNYTVKNFEELPDLAAGNDHHEARVARKHLDSEHLGVSYMRAMRGLIRTSWPVFGLRPIRWPLRRTAKLF